MASRVLARGPRACSFPGHLTSSSFAGQRLTSPLEHRGLSVAPRPQIRARRGRPKHPPNPNAKIRGIAQREKYLKPYMLNVYVSNKYIYARITNRVTSHTVATVTTNEKGFRAGIEGPGQTCDKGAAIHVGEELARRAKDVDVWGICFRLERGEKFEGTLETVVTTLVGNGLTIL